MHSIRIIIIILLLCFFVSSSPANTYRVSPTGSSSDQNIINEALEKVHENGGGTVYLEGGVYTITGSIIIDSNTTLTGDPDAIIRVYSGSDAKQWFTGKNSIISSNGPVDNVEIYGFQIDGSCNELPFHFHHSRADTAHDCERAIYIAGQTGKFCNNIKIHDMQIYDCFSDGIHVRFAEKVKCYGNSIYNCQHEGIFFVSVKNGLMDANKIAGITSDCARLDNCVNCIVQNNYFFSYSGDHNSRAPKGEHNGIQIADAGASHGYDASKKPTTTTNIEVRWNTFANTGERAVWLDSTGKGYENVYIHDNKFVNVKAVTNPGRSVELNMEVTDEPVYHDITDAVEPTNEMSDRIFSDILNLVNMQFIEQPGNYTVVGGAANPPKNVTVTVEQYNIRGKAYTLVSVPHEGLTSIHYKVGNKSAVHTLQIGERRGFNVIYSNVSIWTGNIYRTGDSLYLDGTVEPSDIKVTCYTVKGIVPTNFEVTQTKEEQKGIFDNFIFFYLSILGVLLSIPFFVIAIIFSKRF